jgi:hypothetical protein
MESTIKFAELLQELVHPSGITQIRPCRVS